MDWSKFIRKIRIKATPEQVFSAWTSVNELTHWFLKEVRFDTVFKDKMEEGDACFWIWNNYTNPFLVNVLSHSYPNKLSFTFGDGMEVNLDISLEDGWTILTLEQVNIPVNDEAKMNYYVGCGRAWTFWLANLKCYLEHGITLHDKELGERPNLFDFSNC